MASIHDDSDGFDHYFSYADGELEGQDQIEALRSMASDPEIARQVIFQQQLRDAVAKSAAEVPPMPAAWRAKIVADLAQQSPAVVGSIGSVQRNPWNRKWLTALAAAVLLIASVAVLHVTQRQDSSSGSPLPSTVATVRPMAPSEFSEADIRTVSFDLLSPREVERFDRRHNGCATMTQKLREADWPGNIELLPGALTSHLGAQPYPVLDLSAAGYQFAGAGPCGIPGEPAVHLLYRGEHDTISLWLRPDDGRYDIPEDHFYQTTGENSKHSLLVWRHSGIIYYLVGDNPSHARKACSVLSECDKKKK